jgi:hypothetical protein
VERRSRRFWPALALGYLPLPFQGVERKQRPPAAAPLEECPISIFRSLTDRRPSQAVKCYEHSALCSVSMCQGSSSRQGLTPPKQLRFLLMLRNQIEARFCFRGLIAAAARFRPETRPNGT